MNIISYDSFQIWPIRPVRPARPIRLGQFNIRYTFRDSVIDASFYFRCSNISYDHVSLEASIIIIYHNEALSVLIRMLNSILDRTPSNLLKEIILYDDFSDEDTILIDHLLKYANIERWPIEKFIMKRSNERLGLIRAKVSFPFFSITLIRRSINLKFLWKKK